MFGCVVQYLREMEEDANIKFVRFINNDQKTVEAFVNEFDA